MTIDHQAGGGVGVKGIEAKDNRQAVRHELLRLQRQPEQLAMASSLRAMAQDPTYRKECEALDSELAEALPEEAEAWWTAPSH